MDAQVIAFTSAAAELTIAAGADTMLMIPLEVLCGVVLMGLDEHWGEDHLCQTTY